MRGRRFGVGLGIGVIAGAVCSDDVDAGEDKNMAEAEAEEEV